MWRPFPLKIALPMRGSRFQSDTWFSGPTWILNSNGISIGAAVFVGLTSVIGMQADRQTDMHATRSVITGRIYVRSTAMRPKKWISCDKNDINSYMIQNRNNVLWRLENARICWVNLKYADCYSYHLLFVILASVVFIHFCVSLYTK